MSNLANVTIDGTKVSVPKGTLLVEAARKAGIEIPVFCYHPKLKPVGACRMCLVEIEKMPRLQTACTTPVADGMVVRTKAPAAVEGQQAVLELLLANHPLDCPVCDKGGECPLQDNTFKYGTGASVMHEDKRAKDKAFPLSERIVLDKERCILCYRCTRFQNEVVGDEAIVPLDRGGDSEIGTPNGEPFESPFSGNTVEMCPVGALTARTYRFRARPWDLQHTPSVCSGCSVGCNVTLDSRDGAVLRVMSRDNRSIDDGWLCDRGRYETMPPVTAPGQVARDEAHRRRTLQPYVRQGGQLLPAAWPQALARAAQLLGDRGAALVGGTLGNEAVQALVEQLAPRLSGNVACTDDVATAWPVQGRIANLPQCRRIVLLGLDPWTELPVLALWLRKATTAGAALVVVGSKNGSWRDTRSWLRTDAPIAMAQQLLAALDGGTASEDVAAAAAALQGTGPAALLLHPALAKDPAALAVAGRLASKLGVDAATGLLGAPAFAANARGLQQLAPQFASRTSLQGDPNAILVLGAPALPPASAARLVVATSGAVPERADVDVVLPLAHPYETAATFTNFEGQTQTLRPAGRAARALVSDLELVRHLAAAMTAPAGAV
jgi:NADH-quinone oxidoreductase subunit G